MYLSEIRDEVDPEEEEEDEERAAHRPRQEAYKVTLQQSYNNAENHKVTLQQCMHSYANLMAIQH
jgi:hypothetical protein